MRNLRISWIHKSRRLVSASVLPVGHEIVVWSDYL
jgi:hypothetical protein